MPPMIAPVLAACAASHTTQAILPRPLQRGPPHLVHAWWHTYTHEHVCAKHPGLADTHTIWYNLLCMHGSSRLMHTLHHVPAMHAHCMRTAPQHAHRPNRLAVLPDARSGLLEIQGKSAHRALIDHWSTHGRPCCCTTDPHHPDSQPLFTSSTSHTRVNTS
jgi:hypothetical protein